MENLSHIHIIKQLAEDYNEEIINIRRHIHQNPELSFQEFETAKFIENQLTNFGIKNYKRVCDTGVTFDLEGKKPTKKLIALRADIDALPILEQNSVSYKSNNHGVMHACGHDVHTSSLLGVAKILNQLKDKWEGTIRFIFQPGEEKIPGGASLLIKEGILENPIPNKILGQHVMPFLPCGKVGFKKGKYMASADEIYITIKGKGGHAAMPETIIDPILIASQMIVNMQQVVSRKANPKIPTVLSFGKVIANGATNVIPNEVYIEGTFRTLDENWRFEAHKIIKNIANSVATAVGGQCEIDIKVGYPYLFNNEDYTEKNIQWSQMYLGKENVVDLDFWMAAEDFAFYSQKIDATFYRLGTSNDKKGISSGVHTPTFNIDENALKIGMGLMSWLAICELSYEHKN